MKGRMSCSIREEAYLTRQLARYSGRDHCGTSAATATRWIASPGQLMAGNTGLLKCLLQIRNRKTKMFLPSDLPSNDSLGAIDPESRYSFPLDRRRRLPRNVIHHPRNPRHFVDHAMHDEIQKFIRQSRPARRHEIDGLHSAQRDHIIVAPAIAHDTDGSHRQEHRESLAHLVIQIVPAHMTHILLEPPSEIFKQQERKLA